MTVIKLIQLNTWMGRLSRATLKFVQEQNPDILCLQEVFKSDAPVAYPEDQMFDLFGTLQNSGLFAEAYFSPAVRIDIAGSTAEFGNAIFSKFPLSDQKTLFTDGTEVVSHFTTHLNEGNNPARNAQLVTLELPTGERLALVNQHFHWVKNPLGDENSVPKMQLVAREARDFAGSLPLIIAGDFNHSPESQALQVFDGWLTNAITQTDAQTTLSGLKFPAQEVQVVCDHVLYNDQVMVKQVEVSQELISDHYPVIFEFELGNN